MPVVKAVFAKPILSTGDLAVSRIFASACLAFALVAGISCNTHAALTLSLDANDMTKTGPGPVIFDVDVFINWDGAGTNALSSISFDVTMPSEVTLANETFNASNPPPFKNPFNFDLGGVNNNSVGFTNFAGNAAPFTAGDNRLTTLTLVVNANQGTFPIGLSLVNATTGAGFVDVAGEFTSVTGGDLVVNAVPEPSAACVLGIVAAGVLARRRRRVA